MKSLRLSELRREDKTIDFSKLPIETLMEVNKSLIEERDKFDYRDGSKVSATYGTLGLPPGVWCKYQAKPFFNQIFNCKSQRVWLGPWREESSLYVQKKLSLNIVMNQYYLHLFESLDYQDFDAGIRTKTFSINSSRNFLKFLIDIFSARSQFRYYRELWGWMLTWKIKNSVLQKFRAIRS